MKNPLFRFACFALAAPLAQAEYANDDLFDLSLEELMNIKVSVASISKTSLNESPSSVSLFSRNQIRNMGVTTLEELLNFVPGFHASRRVEMGQAYAISARGRTTAQSSFDILILINGQRLNKEWMGGAFYSNRFISLENVKQVEIIRGPGSAIYGSNAFSGVINIITGDQKDEIAISAGSYSQRQIFGKVNGNIGETKWSLYLDRYTDDGDNYQPDAGLSIATQDPIEKTDAEFKIQSENFHLNLYYNQRELEDFYQFGRFVSNDVNFFQSEQFMLNTEYRWEHSETMKHQIRYEFGYGESDGLIEAIPEAGIRNLPPTVITTGTEAFVGGPLTEEQFSRFSYTNEWQINQQHHLHSGISFRSVDFLTLRNISNYDFADFVQTFVLSRPVPTGPLTYLGEIKENTPFGDEGSRDITSIFIQDKWQLSEKTTATLGIRRDDYSDFGAATTPRIAVVHQYDDNHTFKFMYGEAFRAPSRREQTDRANPVALGNMNIDPEEVSTTEVAWFYASEKLTSGITLFHSSFKQLIQQRPIGGNDPRNSWTNGGELETNGIETEFKWQIEPKFNLSGHLSYLFNTEESPGKFPKLTAAIVANYQHDNLNINLNGTYASSTESLIQNSSGLLEIIEHDAYFHLNSHFIYQLNKQWQINLKINNLLDDDYRTPTNTSALVLGVPNRGRSWVVGVSYHF